MSAPAAIGPLLDVPQFGILGAVQRGVTVLNRVLAVLSAIAVATAGCVLTWEVIGRYFLSIPSDWQDELSTFLLIGATFGSAAWTQARRGHVGIDALAQILPARVDRARRLLADACSLLFVASSPGRAGSCWPKPGMKARPRHPPGDRPCGYPMAA